MTDRWDAIILGGGPGGSTLAASLARLGRRALVPERERFPRFHIGESLLPRSREVFERLGLDEKLDARFLRKYGARFLCSVDGADADVQLRRRVRPEVRVRLPGAARRVRPAAAPPRRGARGGGARVVEAVEVVFGGPRAVGVRAASRSIRGRRAGGGRGRARRRGRRRRARAPVIVDATGRDTLLASRMRRKAQLAELDKTALFTHYEGVPREEGIHQGNIQVVIFEHGWSWFIPFRGEVTSVGAVVSSSWIRSRAKGERLDDLFDRTVAESGWAREFLASARRIRPVGALADFSYRIDQLAGDGWLFVGDAGGFLDPLFSTGAHLAIKGADLAATAIHRALDAGTPRAPRSPPTRRRSATPSISSWGRSGLYKGQFRRPCSSRTSGPRCASSSPACSRATCSTPSGGRSGRRSSGSTIRRRCPPSREARRAVARASPRARSPARWAVRRSAAARFAVQDRVAHLLAGGRERDARLRPRVALQRPSSASALASSTSRAIRIAATWLFLLSAGSLLAQVVIVAR